MLSNANRVLFELSNYDCTATNARTYCRIRVDRNGPTYWSMDSALRAQQIYFILSGPLDWHSSCLSNIRFRYQATSWETTFHACGFAGTIWFILWQYFVSFRSALEHPAQCEHLFRAGIRIRLAGTASENPSSGEGANSEIAGIISD